MLEVGFYNSVAQIRLRVIRVVKEFRTEKLPAPEKSSK